MKASEISGYIFDLDGVIVDTAKYHFLSWRRLANELGFDFTEKQNEQLKGVSRIRSLEIILQMGGIKANEKEKEALAGQKNHWYLEYIAAMNESEVLPGAGQFLAQLRSAGRKIALGSASKNARLILEKVNLMDQFDAVVDGNLVSEAKPNPEVFLKAAALLGLEPADCIVFEDAQAGIEAALRAGMFCIGIGSPDHLQQSHMVLPGLSGLDFEVLENRLLRRL
jgi:beta-phosphoglucomutase